MGATVITNLFGTIPVVGDGCLLLWGGFSVDNPTLNRFFSLHYLLPFLIFGVVILHSGSHVPGNNNNRHIRQKCSRIRHPFTLPYGEGRVFFVDIPDPVFYFIFFAKCAAMPTITFRLICGHAGAYCAGAMHAAFLRDLTCGA